MKSIKETDRDYESMLHRFINFYLEHKDGADVIVPWGHQWNQELY